MPTRLLRLNDAAIDLANVLGVTRHTDGVSAIFHMHGGQYLPTPVHFDNAVGVWSQYINALTPAEPAEPAPPGA